MISPYWGSATVLGLQPFLSSILLMNPRFLPPFAQAAAKMASGLSTAAAEAAKLALRIGSSTAESIMFVVDLGEELPFIKPVLSTLQAIREKMQTVKDNEEALQAVEERCTYLAACVVVKFRRNPSSEIDVSPLQDCVESVGKLVNRCCQQGCCRRCMRASSDKDEIARLDARVTHLVCDLGLAGIATLEGKTDEIKEMLVRFLAEEKTSPHPLAHYRSETRTTTAVPSTTFGTMQWRYLTRLFADACSINNHRVL